ncbi:hypothetical protein N7451_012500 [Penicillium sp. IBT 35674x]|nr:hypothetical protein N7451_012500 [Penicillium sp. IBT 35674x]
MSNIIKEVDGTLVTNTDIEPPNDWTNNYEDMGGDMQWSEYGEFTELVKAYGLTGTVKPLFAMASYTGEAISLFELSDNHYIYNAISDSLFRIDNPTDPQTIVSTIDDPDQGMAMLDIEAV